MDIQNNYSTTCYNKYDLIVWVNCMCLDKSSLHIIKCLYKLFVQTDFFNQVKVILYTSMVDRDVIAQHGFRLHVTINQHVCLDKSVCAYEKLRLV